MKKTCVYQCLETRKLTDKQPLISHFDYLVKFGHQIDDGKLHDFYSFGFDSVTPEGVRTEIVQYVDDVRSLKKQKRLANNVNDIAFTDMVSLPLDYTDEMVNELATSLYMLDPSVPCCFVLHEKSNKGKKHPHLQMIRLKRTKDGLERMNDKVRLGMMQLTRKTIGDTFKRHGYALKAPTERQHKHVKTAKEAIRNFARHDAIRAGEADIKAGISERVTSADFLLKLATNQLDGQQVENSYIRAVAKEEAKLRSLKEYRQTAKKTEDCFVGRVCLRVPKSSPPPKPDSSQSIESPKQAQKMTTINLKIDKSAARQPGLSALREELKLVIGAPPQIAAPSNSASPPPIPAQPTVTTKQAVQTKPQKTATSLTLEKLMHAKTTEAAKTYPSSKGARKK